MDGKPLASEDGITSASVYFKISNIFQKIYLINQIFLMIAIRFFDNDVNMMDGETIQPVGNLSQILQ